MMKDLITAKTSQTTMSSLELVEFVNSLRLEGEPEVRHDNFMAKVPKVLGENHAPTFLGTQTYGNNNSRSIYNFPKREACLMAMSYSYELQAVVYDRMTELEKLPEVYPLLQRQEQALRLTKYAIEAARAYGFEGNQAILSADKAVKTMVGVSTLALMGAELIKEDQHLNLTATEIGKELTPPLSAIATNKLLDALGFQEKLGAAWSPTEKGKPFAIFLDTGKKHSDGTPITQLKWLSSIIKHLT